MAIDIDMDGKQNGMAPNPYILYYIILCYTQIMVPELASFCKLIFTGNKAHGQKQDRSHWIIYEITFYTTEQPDDTYTNLNFRMKFLVLPL